MCTVTFIPVKDTVCITSSRDEKLKRPIAFRPAAYTYNGCRLYGPVDAAAGGTWIAVKENGDAAVLLNGAFERHIPCPPYRLSRGIIFLDLLTANRPSLFFADADLHNIEPFTFILYEEGLLYECRWDGQEKCTTQLSATSSYIWSSATLYDRPVIKKREKWFEDFLSKRPSPGQQDILNFHRFTGDGDSANSLLMSRDNIYSTVSITGIQLQENNSSICYTDTLNNTTESLPLSLSISPAIV